MVSDIPQDSPEVPICEIPFGYYIPVFWCLCFYFLSRNRFTDARRQEPVVVYATPEGQV